MTEVSGRIPSGSRDKASCEGFGAKPPKAEHFRTVNFACNFAHELCEYAENPVGMLHLQTQMGERIPLIFPASAPTENLRKRKGIHSLNHTEAIAPAALGSQAYVDHFMQYGQRQADVSFYTKHQ